MANSPIAFITPTCKRDIERFRLLVDSIRACVGGRFEHYVVVHEGERRLFKRFQNQRTHLLSSAEILDSSIDFTVADADSVGRYRYRGKPVSGWYAQQLVKLAAPQLTDAETVVLLDSDFFFLKHLDAGEFFPGEHVPLFGVDDGGAMCAKYPAWYDTASRLIALPGSRTMNFNYVTKPVCWLRGCVLRLQERIERVNQRPWQTALLDSQEFSEYTLYGMYVENNPEERARHRLTSNWGTRIKYSFTPQSAVGVAQYFGTMEQDLYGVAIHRSCGIPVQEYRPVVETLWNGP